MALQTGQIESESDARELGSTDAELWLQKINKQLEEEEEWRKEARMAVAIFEAKTKVSGLSYSKPVFNIFHSNVQTLVPAVYNSTPIPDVRRRFGDKDKQARYGSQLAERMIQSNLDSHDFDHGMRRVVRSASLWGRGVARIRYEPLFGPGQNVDGGENGQLDHEAVKLEWVPTDRYVQGPAQNWDEVPWVAYRHDLSKDEVTKLILPEQPELPDEPEPPQLSGHPILDAPETAKHQSAMASHGKAVDSAMDQHAARMKDAQDRLRLMSFDASPLSMRDGSQPVKGVLKTLSCYEVFDKSSKSVIWIAEHDTKLPLAVFPDFLKLSGFFHSARPLTVTDGESSMVPVCPYNVYADLLDEIDDATRRIKVIIGDMKVRALSDPKMQKDIEALSNATDGDVISSGVSELWQQGARTGISNLIMFWPNDQNVAMLKSLMEHREAIKQIIYEVTGISDILRGASNANETATAQQIKATWGSQRVQEMQTETARFAKDAFRMMAETMFNVFQEQTIRDMTLLPEPIDAEQVASQVPQPTPQAPAQDPQTGQPIAQNPEQQAAQQKQLADQYRQAQQQAVQAAQQASEKEFTDALAMMKSKLRMYRVDIETDSTIKSDMADTQKRMSDFLGATAQFGQSMATIAPVLPAIVPHLTAIYCSFVRRQKLGKNIEDVLDRLETASETPPTPQQPQGPQQDPQADERESAQQAHEQATQASQQSHEQAMAQHDDKTQQTALATVNAKNQGMLQGKQMDMDKIKLQKAMPPGMPIGGMATEPALQ